MDDPHTLLVEANAQLKGVINIAAGASEQKLEQLTGFELLMLLTPITERIEKAMNIIA